MGYGRGAFHKAVSLLVTSPRSVQERLADATVQFILPLYPPEIPRNPPSMEERNRRNCEKDHLGWTELQDDFSDLLNKLTDCGALKKQDAVRDYILAMNDKRASSCSEGVFLLYHRYLTQEPASRVITKAEAQLRLKNFWCSLPKEDQQESHMYTFWLSLNMDDAEVLNLRTSQRGDWQEVHGWLSKINESIDQQAADE